MKGKRSLENKKKREEGSCFKRDFSNFSVLCFTFCVSFTPQILSEVSRRKQYQ